MPVASLSDRAVLSVTGQDARSFLQNLITCDVDALKPGEGAFGALLTPQGKILFDFLVVCTDENDFLIDTARDQAPALAKRLTMYRLRAKVLIAATNKTVMAVWGDSTPPQGFAYLDPRDASLGRRVFVEGGDDLRESADDYEAHRIAAGVPKGGADFAWGDAFPHEVNMDLLRGVSFTKGCYVGQEVVSRMQHRGTTRRRIVRAAFDGTAPRPGAEIRAGDTLLGTFGSSADGHGLAAVRIDRLDDAMAAGNVPTADDEPLRLTLP